MVLGLSQWVSVPPVIRPHESMTQQMVDDEAPVSPADEGPASAAV